MSADSLPIGSARLPMSAGGLPMTSAALPMTFEALPMMSEHLPMTSAALPIGFARLPTSAERLPIGFARLPIGFAQLPTTKACRPKFSVANNLNYLKEKTMNDRVRNIFDMFVSTVEFDAVNLNDYRSLTDAAANFAVVREVIAVLQNDFADQLSGAVAQAVEQKSVTRAAIRRRMKRFAATARGLNIDDPGLRRLFRVPDENSDQILLAAAREFVEEATRFAAQFAGRGISAAEIEALTSDITALETTNSAKAGAQIEGVGATAGIDDEIERGMKAAVILDSIMKNVYYDNAVKLAQWKTARHVRSSVKRTSGGANTAPSS
jgi:hypothetical protein